MAKYTDVYNLRYPEPSDNANVPDDIKQLAQGVDNALATLSETMVTTTGFKIWSGTVNVNAETSLVYPVGYDENNTMIVCIIANYVTDNGLRSVPYIHPQQERVFSIDCYLSSTGITVSCVGGSNNATATHPIVSAEFKIIFMKYETEGE